MILHKCLRKVKISATKWKANLIFSTILLNNLRSNLGLRFQQEKKTNGVYKIIYQPKKQLKSLTQMKLEEKTYGKVFVIVY